MATLNMKDLDATMEPILDAAIRARMKTCGVPDDLIEKAMAHDGDDQAELIHALCVIYATETFEKLSHLPIQSRGVRVALQIKPTA